MESNIDIQFCKPSFLELCEILLFLALLSYSLFTKNTFNVCICPVPSQAAKPAHHFQSVPSVLFWVLVSVLDFSEDP